MVFLSLSAVFSHSFANKAQMMLKPLLVPRQSYNANGSENTAGVITHYIALRLNVNDHSKLCHFYVIDLVNQDLFLGYDWLHQHNPTIDWKSNSLFLSCVDHCAKAANKLPTLNFFTFFPMVSQWTWHKQRTWRKMKSNSLPG